MRTVRGCLVALCVLAGLALGPAAWAQGTLYRLEAGSNRQEGCFEPCLCPIFINEDLVGTFNLIEASGDRCTRSFKVKQINWVFSSGGADVRVTGEGTYEIFGCGPWVRRQHRLILDLVEDSGRARHFDSGVVPGGNEFPSINIAVALNGFYCYDTAYQVVAEPVRDSDVTRYGLHHTEYLEGCFAPCRCALLSWVAVGGFSLVDINTSADPLRKRYAVVEFAADTVGPIDPPARSFTGFGVYSTGRSDHRLVLDIKDATTGDLRLDSGIVAYDGAWPEINIDLSDNNFYCFNHAFYLHARPN